MATTLKYSYISGKPIQASEIVSGSEIRESIFDLIREDFPAFRTDDVISIYELNKYRRLYLTRLVEQERGELAKLDQDVMTAIRENSLLTQNLQEEAELNPTIGERLADKIAAFGGSWIFIISFFVLLSAWMLLNSVLLVTRAFDPFPYILLNLILSCMAAIQAPIIMMSQNRQEQKDRIRAEHDYKINLKAELEIKLLSEKMDHLLVHQNKKLLEIQDVQIDYLEDLLRQRRDENKDIDK
ncbi:MAG: DUF1003 domain-containing protein [Bacteroidia bacterium]|jgi:uncharacterized membrane protein